MPLIYAAIIYAYMPAILTGIFALCVLYLIIFWARSAAQRRDRRDDARFARETDLIWRAEYENELAQRGDPVGIYGNYSPSTMPLTNPYGLFGGWE